LTILWPTRTMRSSSIREVVRLSLTMWTTSVDCTQPRQISTTWPSTFRVSLPILGGWKLHSWKWTIIPDSQGFTCVINGTISRQVPPQFPTQDT
jgi:hypothetical protein